MPQGYGDGQAVAALSNAPPFEIARRVSKPVRRRWQANEIRYLDTWVGIRSVAELCRSLHRTERALRCKLHMLGLSAKVREGWSLSQVQRDLHLGRRAVLRHLIEGSLRVHSAQVCARAHQLSSDVYPSPASMPSACSPASHTLPISELGTALGLSRKKIVAAARTGSWRLIHVRITDSSVQRVCTNGQLGARRSWLSDAMRRWLHVDKHVDDAPSYLPLHLARMHTCARCARQVRGNAFFRHCASCIAARAGPPCRA
jgi:hypothetical protein